jgi:hypothetical protein
MLKDIKSLTRKLWDQHQPVEQKQAQVISNVQDDGMQLRFTSVADGISGSSRVAVLMDNDMQRIDTENQQLQTELSSVEERVQTEIRSGIPKLQRLVMQLTYLEVGPEALDMVRRELDVGNRVCGELVCLQSKPAYCRLLSTEKNPRCSNTKIR